MKRSFYHFALKYRGDQNKEIAQFANDIYEDHDFPKQSFDYHKISTYLEFHSLSMYSLSTFDMLWEIYKSDELKLL
jgi:uncharacterized protein YozE (UPF0346 family)